MTDQIRGGPPPIQDRSSAQLTQELSNQISRMVRDEVRLATAELRWKVKQAGIGAAAGTLAAGTALLGGAAMIAGAIAALALVLPGWPAALIVGGVFVLLAGMLGGTGFFQVKRNSPPVPDKALEGVKKDIRAAKGGKTGRTG